MYEEDVEAWGHPRPSKSQQSSGRKAAEARLANLHEERKRKKFWEDFRRREDRFQNCQRSGRDYKATARDFFRRSLTKGFRRSNTGGSFRASMRNTNMRHAVLGSTDGFKRGLSHSHGQPVPEQTLRKAFREIDADNDGLISVRELTRALRRCGVDASRQTVERILQDCGYAAGQVSADQFIRFFRATENLVWSVDEEYNPVDSCCTYCGRFLLFLLLIAALVMLIILLRIESSTEIFVGLLIAWFATIGAFCALMIPVICIPVRRAMKLGKQRRIKEQAAIDAIRAPEAKPQKVQRAKTAEAKPKSGLTWLEDFYTGPPAIQGSRSEPRNLSRTEVEAYNPEQYRVAQDAAARAPRKGGIRPAWSGAFSTDALEDDEKQRQRHRNLISEPNIWRQPLQPQPHQVPRQQPQMHSTVELLQNELQSGRGRDYRVPPSHPPPPRKAQEAQAKKEPVASDLVMTDCD